MVRRNDFKAIFGAATFNSPIKNVNKSHKGRGGSSNSKYIYLRLTYLSTVVCITFIHAAH